MRREVSIAFVLVGLAATGWGQGQRTTVPLSGVSGTALRYFQQAEGYRFDEFLQRLRPPRLSSEVRARLLEVLSPADVVSASARQQAKLQALGPIFRYHDREATMEVKVLRIDGASAALLAGAAILITEPALEVLSSEELQATVAHELGHEYFWDDFELARQQGQYATLQELELRCDGVSVITLHALGLEPEKLLAAVRKLTRYNGPPDSGPHASRYVTLKEREAFILSMIGMVREAGGSPQVARRP